MNNTQILETVYDTIAQNTVDGARMNEVTNRIDHIDYEDGYIQFDTFRLQIILNENVRD
jgi:hypothetical protein